MQSNFAAYEWPLNGTIQVVYVDNNRHIHELSQTQKGQWQYTDLTSLTGAPPLV